MTSRNFFLSLVALVATACSTTGPSDTTGAIASATYPPPAGVNPAFWPMGFGPDGVLRKAKNLHVDLPATLDEATKSVFVTATKTVAETPGMPTIDFTQVPGGRGRIEVVLIPGFLCGDVVKAACWAPRYEGNEIVGGRLVFISNTSMKHLGTVIHEFYHAGGLQGHAPPNAGVMSPASIGSSLSPEEQAVVNAWKDLPAGAQCSGCTK